MKIKDIPYLIFSAFIPAFRMLRTQIVDAIWAS